MLIPENNFRETLAVGMELEEELQFHPQDETHTTLLTGTYDIKQRIRTILRDGGRPANELPFRNRVWVRRCLFSMCYVNSPAFPFSVFNNIFTDDLYDQLDTHDGLTVSISDRSDLPNPTFPNNIGNDLEAIVDYENRLEIAHGLTNLFVDVPGLNTPETLIGGMERRNRQRLNNPNFFVPLYPDSLPVHPQLLQYINATESINTRFRIIIGIPTYLSNFDDFSPTGLRQAFARIFVSLLEGIFHAKYFLSTIQYFKKNNHSVDNLFDFLALTPVEVVSISSTYRKLFMYGFGNNQDFDFKIYPTLSFPRCFAFLRDNEDCFQNFHLLRTQILIEIRRRQETYRNLIRGYIKEDRFQDLRNLIATNDRLSFYR